MDRLYMDMKKFSRREELYSMGVWFRNILIDVLVKKQFPIVVKVEVLNDPKDCGGGRKP